MKLREVSMHGILVVYLLSTNNSLSESEQMAWLSYLPWITGRFSFIMQIILYVGRIHIAHVLAMNNISSWEHACFFNFYAF